MISGQPAVLSIRLSGVQTTSQYAAGEVVRWQASSHSPHQGVAGWAVGYHAIGDLPWQRRSMLVPGSNGSIVLSIGDITGGMVLVSLNDRDSAASRRTPATMLRETPMVAGELVDFEVEDQKYIVFLQRWDSTLFGDDEADFSIVRQKDVTDEMKKAHARRQSKPQKIKCGGQIETHDSGTLECRGITPAGSVDMTLNGMRFTRTQQLHAGGRVIIAVRSRRPCT